MHKLFWIIMGFFIVSFATTAQATETYKFDPSHSYVAWHINHFGFSNPTGKWMPEGVLILDMKQPQNSKVSATIHVSDLITGIDELNKHLTGKSFFDVAKYPTATFVSNKVTITGKETAKIHGMLTVHGVTKPIVLNVKLNKIGVNPISNKESVGFSATTVLKRSDFGIDTLLPGISDNVQINIETEAYKI